MRPRPRQLTEFTDDLSPILFYKSQSSLLGSRQTSQMLIPRSPVSICKHWCQIAMPPSPFSTGITRSPPSPEPLKQATAEPQSVGRYNHPRPARKVSPSRQSIRLQRKSPKTLYHYSYEALSPRSRQRISTCDAIYTLSTTEDQEEEGPKANAMGERRVPKLGASEGEREESFRRGQSDSLAVGGVVKVTDDPDICTSTPSQIESQAGEEDVPEENSRAVITSSGVGSAHLQVKFTIGPPVERKSVMSKAKTDRGKSESRKTVRILQAEQQVFEKDGYSYIQSLDDLDGRTTRPALGHEDSLAGSSSLSDDELVDILLPRYRLRTDSLYTLRSCLSISEESLSQTTDDMKDLSVYSDESASIDEFELCLRGSRDRRKEIKMFTIPDDNEELSEARSEVNVKGKSESLNTLLSCYNIPPAPDPIPSTVLEQCRKQDHADTEEAKTRANYDMHISEVDDDIIDSRNRSPLGALAVENSPADKEDESCGAASHQILHTTSDLAGCGGDTSEGYEENAQDDNNYKIPGVGHAPTETNVFQADDEQAITTTEPEELKIAESQEAVKYKDEDTVRVDTDINWSKGQSSDGSVSTDQVDKKRSVSRRRWRKPNYDIADGNPLDASSHEASTPADFLSVASSSGTLSGLAVPEFEFPTEDDLRDAVEGWISFYGIQDVQYDDVSHLNKPHSTAVSDTNPSLWNSTSSSAKTHSMEDFTKSLGMQSLSSAAKYNSNIQANITEAADMDSPVSDLLRVGNFGVAKDPQMQRLSTVASACNEFSKGLSTDRVIGSVTGGKYVEPQINEQRDHRQILTVPIQVHATIDGPPFNDLTSEAVGQSRSRWNRPTVNHLHSSAGAKFHRKCSDRESLRESWKTECMLDRELNEALKEIDLNKQDDLTAETTLLTKCKAREKVLKEMEQFWYRDTLQTSSFPNLPALSEDPFQDTSKLMAACKSNDLYPAESEMSKSCPDTLHLGQSHYRPVTTGTTISASQDRPGALSDYGKDDDVITRCSHKSPSSSVAMQLAPNQHDQTGVIKSEMAGTEELVTEYPWLPNEPNSLNLHEWTVQTRTRTTANPVDERAEVKNNTELGAIFSTVSEPSEEDRYRVSAGRREDLLFTSPGLNAVEHFPKQHSFGNHEDSKANCLVDGRDVSEITSLSLNATPTDRDVEVAETACNTGEEYQLYPIFSSSKTDEANVPVDTVWSCCEIGHSRNNCPVPEMPGSSLQFMHPKSEQDLERLRIETYQKTEFERKGKKNGLHARETEQGPQKNHFRMQVNGKAREIQLELNSAHRELLNMSMIGSGTERRPLSKIDWHTKEMLESLSVTRRAFLVELGLYQDFLFGLLPLTDDLLQGRDDLEDSQCPVCLIKAREQQDDQAGREGNGQEGQMTFSVDPKDTDADSAPEQDRNASRFPPADTPGRTAGQNAETPAETLSPGPGSKGQSESGSKTSVITNEDSMLRSSDFRYLVNLRQRCSQVFQDSYKRASFERLKVKDPELCILLSLLLLVCVQLICWFPVTVLYLLYDVKGFPPKPTDQELLFLCIWCARMAVQPFLYAFYSKYFRQNYCHLLPCSF